MSLGCPRTATAAALQTQRRRIDDGWNSPARQAARTAQRLTWAQAVLANPDAHTDDQITRAARIRGCAIAAAADRGDPMPEGTE